MRFTEIAKIDTVALAASTTIGIAMAKVGFGYWALVMAAVSLPFVTTIGLWLATKWVPGPPRRGVGLHSLMKFGGSLTLVSVIVYIAYNLEKVLLGRFWGADAVGIYGRAYQLINIPTDNLNSGVGEVAFSALSRVQNDPERLRTYFLKGYSLVLALTIPITIAVAVFARDLVAVLLGPKWSNAAEIFQLLAPTILIFALINPIGWLIFSLGMMKRSLQVAMVLAPLVITGYALGLPYGPKGVAIGYSAVMTLWLVPHIAWGLHGTAVSLSDIFRTLSRPLTSGFVAGVLALLVHIAMGQRFSPIIRLMLGGLVLLSAYAGTLLYVMRQKRFYLDLVSSLKRRSPIEQPQLVTVQ
jgi:PST family polysaccharide transporter